MAKLEKVAASWSGGKDSCLACYKAMKKGYQIKYLMNFISKKHKRCCFHGIEKDLINIQAKTIGIPLSQKAVSPDMKKYEKEFKEAVNKLKLKGVKGMVFGDIDLEEHKFWVERVCKEIDILAVEPLWGLKQEKVINEFINLGFKAIVVSAKSELFDKKWLGREINKDFLEELKKKNISPCGENGEYHTFVIDGPIFKKRIEITKSRTIFKKGFWPHWFLDIQKWQVNKKV